MGGTLELNAFKVSNSLCKAINFTFSIEASVTFERNLAAAARDDC